MSDVIPEPLLAYLAKRDVDRVDRAAAKFASFTDRERALIKDAAVMGYVQGMRHPQDETIPKDGQVVALVIDACLAHPDLYPAINADAPEAGCAECGHPADQHTDPDEPVSVGQCRLCALENEDDSWHDYEDA